MPTEIEERQFIDEIKRCGCTVSNGTKHRKEVLYKGMVVSTYSIRHGKGVKGDPITMGYVTQFRKMLPIIKTQVDGTH
jgi:hypothetical protein